MPMPGLVGALTRRYDDDWALVISRHSMIADGIPLIVTLLMRRHSSLDRENPGSQRPSA